MDLQSYVDKYGVKKTALARILKVNRGTINRICLGLPCRPKLAKRIEEVTRGEVKASELMGWDKEE